MTINFSFSILQNNNFRLLMLARMFCHAALQSLAVIVGWQIYSLTDSVLLLGLVGLAEAIPAICSAFFSGYIVDKSTPRKIYLLCTACMVLILASMMVVGGGYLGLDNNHIVICLFIGIFLTGIARSFMTPAHFSILPQIVERHDYSSASAWTNVAWQVASIGAPIAAGLIYGFYGATSAWFLPVTFIILGFLCVTMFGKLREYETVPMKETALQNIIEGWKFIVQKRMLLTVMVIDMVAVLFAGAVALLPAFADEILKVGPEGLGILRTAPALGAIITALYFAIQPMKILTLNRLLLAVAAFGICMIGFALSTSFALSIFFLALSGLFDTVSVVIRQTLKQLLTPDHMRGRVSAINSMFVVSSNEIGAFESGVAAKFMGLVPSVIFGGIVSLCVVGITYLVTPNLRRMVIDDKTKIDDIK
jgi:MFS family permease